MTHHELAGVFPVIATPFSADDLIDVVQLQEELDWIIGCGVDGVTIAMVSEVLRLTDAERRFLCEATLAAADGRVPVVTSVGAESAHAAVGLAVHAQEAGATALMAIPPMAVPLPEEQVLEYFESVLAATSIPLVVQDASGYLGRPISMHLYISLLDRYGSQRVLFKPEATPIGPRLSLLREASHGAARVFEGTGGIALVDSHRRGVVGTMPGPDIPWALVALWRALENGDQGTVDAINGPLASLVAMQSSLDSFLAVEKYLLVKQGVLRSDHRRRPYSFEVDPETEAEIDRLFCLLQAATEVRTHG